MPFLFYSFESEKQIWLTKDEKIKRVAVHAMNELGTVFEQLAKW